MEKETNEIKEIKIKYRTIMKMIIAIEILSIVGMIIYILIKH